MIFPHRPATHQSSLIRATDEELLQPPCRSCPSPLIERSIDAALRRSIEVLATIDTIPASTTHGPTIAHSHGRVLHTDRATTPNVSSAFDDSTTFSVVVLPENCPTFSGASSDS